MNVTVQRLRSELLARDSGKEPPSQGADYRTLREFNNLLILNYVRLQGPIARVAIAQQTGLSKTTVSNIVDQLLQVSLVEEGDSIDAASTGGRRPILVQFNADLGITLGIEVGYSHLTIVATNLAGKTKTVFSESFDLAATPSTSVSMLATSIRIFMAKFDLQWEQVLGIGIGICAPVDSRNHTLLIAPAQHSWGSINICDILSQEFQVPVYLDNDANLGALAEGRYGVAKRQSDFAYIKLGQGIGAGLIQNRQIYRGFAGGSGEIGHLHIADNGPLCSCGKTGCLESVANNSAIIEDAVQGRSLARVPTTTRRGHPPPMLATYDDVDINDVLHAATQGDLASQLALQQAGSYIGSAIATLITLQNPQTVIVDGEVARSCSYFTDALRDKIAQHAFHAAAHVSIIISQLGDLAVALGAAALVTDTAFLPSSGIADFPNI